MAKYVQDETVLAFHGPLIYEAKILKVEVGANGKPTYFVHYQNWKKKWDEWLLPDRIMKDDAAGRQKQRDCLDALKKEKEGKRDDKRKSGASGADGEKKKKRKIDVARELEEDDVEEEGIKLNIPNLLKKQLVDDYYYVVQQKKLVTLPAKKPVSAIVSDFVESLRLEEGKKDAKASANDRCVAEVAQALQLYFDRALGTILLYRFERLQFDDIQQSHSGQRMSDVYGVEHLLRLFVKLPFFLSKCNMEEGETKMLQQRLNEFLKYLGKQDLIFMDAYKKAPTDYIQTFSSIVDKENIADL